MALFQWRIKAVPIRLLRQPGIGTAGKTARLPLPASAVRFFSGALRHLQIRILPVSRYRNCRENRKVAATLKCGAFFASARPESMEKTIKNGRAMPAPTLWDHVPTMPVGATIGRPLYDREAAANLTILLNMQAWINNEKAPHGELFSVAHLRTYRYVYCGSPVSELPGKPQGCRYPQVRCVFSVAH